MNFHPFNLPFLLKISWVDCGIVIYARCPWFSRLQSASLPDEPLAQTPRTLDLALYSASPVPLLGTSSVIPVPQRIFYQVLAQRRIGGCTDNDPPGSVPEGCAHPSPCWRAVDPGENSTHFSQMCLLLTDIRSRNQSQNQFPQ